MFDLLKSLIHVMVHALDLVTRERRQIQNPGKVQFEYHQTANISLRKVALA